MGAITLQVLIMEGLYIIHCQNYVKFWSLNIVTSLMTYDFAVSEPLLLPINVVPIKGKADSWE